MNRTIKVIDLINMIAKGKELPNKIRFHELTYTKKTLKFVPTLASENNIDFIEFIRARNLNEEVEIIEEEPKIDIQGIKEVGIEDISNIDGYAPDRIKNKINELIKAVKELDNQINNK